MLVRASGLTVFSLVVGLGSLSCKPQPSGPTGPDGAGPTGPDKDAVVAAVRARFETALLQLNDGPCNGRPYVQQELREPVKVIPHEGVVETELVVRIRERCVPVWNTVTKKWEMQTKHLRTYGFPKDPSEPITEADADDPNSPKIAWSAPGPTFVMSPATTPGAGDGTRFKMRLFNRMPHDGDPTACTENIKCNINETDESGNACNPGVDPNTGECKVPPTRACGGFPGRVPSQQLPGGRVVEPPNCFHGNNSTNFHFHGFHVSPQLGQDFVGMEIRPPLPKGVDVKSMPSHGAHGGHSEVRYGHFDYELDPLRFTQPPGTHWYHAHKHGSTALHVLNGQVGTFEIRGRFDNELNEYFEKEGGGPLRDRLMVVQQLEERTSGLGGTNNTGAVLINGQANPIVRMKRGEIQRWRFVGATMQASAALNIGFPETETKPEIRQIAMDGVQFSRDNYECQPFLNNPDCSKKPDDTEFDEVTSFNLSPGNRVDVLVRAPDTAGTHCLLMDITSGLHEQAKDKIVGALVQRAELVAEGCGLSGKNQLGPLFTLVIEEDAQPMTFPTKAQFPTIKDTAPYLADLPQVTSPQLQKELFYEMTGRGDLVKSQFWISQTKYNPTCADETLILDQPEQWTLWNNSAFISHPFHIHQNPFQLLSQSDRPGAYKYPVWRDTIALPKATHQDAQKNPSTPAPNSDPVTYKWGKAEIVYEAKEFTGGFVNHCHILGHEDRGMMHNTQASCSNEKYAETRPVPEGATCDEEGFCPGDCELGGPPIDAMPQCPAPPAQTSDWPAAYGIASPKSGKATKGKGKGKSKAKAKGKSKSKAKSKAKAKKK